MSAGFKSSPRQFHILAKPIGPICNLDCKYCFYLKKEALFPETESFRMSDEVLESFIIQYANSQPAAVKEVNIAWQGGEPTLMGLDFFRKSIEIAEKNKRPGTTHNYSIQTNGILIDDDWACFLKEHNFLVGISIDGPEELHDRYRLDKGGRGTFKKVMRGLEFLKKRKVDFNALVCVNRLNSYYAGDVYKFLKGIGAEFFQFIPIVERDPDGSISEWTVESGKYGRFMNKIFDLWLKNDDVGRIFVRDFDNILAMVMGYPASLCITAEACGRAAAIEHNGDLYSCDHFVNPEDKLGNILQNGLVEMIDGPQQTKFGQDKKDKLPEYCKNCEFLRVCNGGCPKDRIINTPDGQPGLNYLCEGFKIFYAHTLPVFEKMAACLRQGRPASDYREIE